MSKNAYILTVSFRSPSGQEEVLKRFLESIISIALQSPGCIKHDLYQSIENPSILMFYEYWTSKEAHEQYIARPEVKKWRTKLDNLLDEPYKLYSWTKVSWT